MAEVTRSYWTEGNLQNFASNFGLRSEEAIPFADGTMTVFDLLSEHAKRRKNRTLESSLLPKYSALLTIIRMASDEQLALDSDIRVAAFVALGKENPGAWERMLQRDREPATDLSRFFIPTDGYVTETQAAKILGVSRTKIRTLIQQGQLTSYSDSIDKRKHAIPIQQVEAIALAWQHYS